MLRFTGDQSASTSPGAIAPPSNGGARRKAGARNSDSGITVEAASVNDDEAGHDGDIGVSGTHAEDADAALSALRRRWEINPMSREVCASSRTRSDYMCRSAQWFCGTMSQELLEILGGGEASLTSVKTASPVEPLSRKRSRSVAG